MNNVMRWAMGALLALGLVMVGVVVGQRTAQPVEDPAPARAAASTEAGETPAPAAPEAAAEESAAPSLSPAVGWGRFVGFLLLVACGFAAWWRVYRQGAEPTTALRFIPLGVVGLYLLGGVPLGWVEAALNGHLDRVVLKAALHAGAWAAALWLLPVVWEHTEEAVCRYRPVVTAAAAALVLWWVFGTILVQAPQLSNRTGLAKGLWGVAGLLAVMIARRLHVCLAICPGQEEILLEQRRRMGRATIGAVVESLLVIGLLTGALQWWVAQRPQLKTGASPTVAAVRGVPRDVFYLEQFSRATDQPWTPPAPDGSGKISREALDNAYGGYTLVLGTGDRAAGWLPLAELSYEAKERLDTIIRLQERARERKILRPDQRAGTYEVIWADPETGLPVPYRFYQEADGRWFRVVGDDTLYGPGGEKVVDISLYASHPRADEIVGEVHRHWDGKRSYDGAGKARHLNLF